MNAVCYNSITMAQKTKTGVKTTKTPKITTQQTKITKEQVQDVIDYINKGKSERASCKLVGINRATFRVAAMRHNADNQYAEALYLLAQQQVEKIELTIEDMRAKRIDSQMARVEIDARKWFASKFLPKQYGDKVDVTTNGKDMPTPIILVNNQEEPKEIDKQIIDL